MATLPGGEIIITGTPGDDNLKGAKQDDTVRGGKGNDKLMGKQGNDLLIGGAGDDRLKAGSGDDWLLGGAGDDILKGGKGADQFRIAGSDGAGDEFITDLNFAQGDALVLSGFRPGTFDDVDGRFEGPVQNDLDITGSGASYGVGAVINSLADIVELAAYSAGVIARPGEDNSLILEIDNGNGIHTLHLKHFLNDFLAAGGEFYI